MPATSSSSAVLVGVEVGREAALVADGGRKPRVLAAVFFSAWKTSVPTRSASAKLGAPAGTTMNSWKSTELSAWAPPLRTFIIGTGRTSRRPAPPR